jgi:putative ABC transport system permease protein
VLGLTWLGGLAARRRGRLLGAAAGVAIAVALLASLGSFLAASKATMTSRSAADVAVDWQIEAQPGADPTEVLRTVRGLRGIAAAMPVGVADTSGLQASVGGSTQITGPGKVLGLPDGYGATFPGELRGLAGARAGTLLAQQTAANLHARPGDTIRLGRAGLPPATVRVDGVVDLPQADSLFQKVGAPTGAQPQAPPDNVLLLSARRWHALFDPLASIRPDLVHSQVHVRLDRRLPADPAAAYTAVTGAARNLETRLAGAGLVGDNLGAALAAARSDALYAQVLFVFLGLPGAILAGLLTNAAAGAGRQRRRGEQALLRARGATTRQLVRLALVEAAAVAVLGVVAGLAAAMAIGRLAFNTPGFGATALAAIGWAAGAALAGLLIAAATVVLPARRDAMQVTVSAARRAVGRAGPPGWARLGLDLWLLTAAIVVFWLTSRGGYQLVLAPEGVPAISVSYWAFAGPALLWAAVGLLAWRLADLALRRGQTAVRSAARPLAGALAGTLAASLARQRNLLARALILVALTLSFAISTAVFNATYRQQADVDARLTNGADVTVTEPPGSNLGPQAADELAAIPGVRHVEPLQHRFAYVGNDLQDLYGVRPATVVAATKLQDAYFAGGTAAQLIGRLASQPDGVLVSAETVRDYQLNPGDTLLLRLQDARTKRATPVHFHYLGVAKEFPTAPRDSFLVANADYIARTTGNPAVGAFLIDTRPAPPRAVADRVRARLGTSATVTDLDTTRHLVGSSLTAVDLAGLTRLELAFALVLAAAASGLVLALGLTERRRTFAIAAALGAGARELGAFVWAEAAVVTIGGLAAGTAGGWALSAMLVKVLTGVFDPPPATLAVPWSYLTATAAAALVAVAATGAGVVRSARRPSLHLLRETP